ncbi:MAG: hypothetical protein K1X75_00810 [Leptospirales bacterium]|nr:hypothetical protein [Leptospirales bacterium]
MALFPAVPEDRLESQALEQARLLIQGALSSPWSHALNNALNVTLLRADALAEAQDESQFTQDLEALRKAAERAADLNEQVSRYFRSRERRRERQAIAAWLDQVFPVLAAVLRGELQLSWQASGKAEATFDAGLAAEALVGILLTLNARGVGEIQASLDPAGCLRLAPVEAAEELNDSNLLYRAAMLVAKEAGLQTKAGSDWIELNLAGLL